MTNDFETGYGKPPREHQFKKGRSGNPKGRPKGAKNLQTVLEEVLQEQILIREGGQERRVSRLTAMVKSQTAKGIKGGTQAASVIFNLICRLRDEDESEGNEAPLSEDELAILENFEASILHSGERR